MADYIFDNLPALNNNENSRGFANRSRAGCGGTNPTMRPTDLANLTPLMQRSSGRPEIAIGLIDGIQRFIQLPSPLDEGCASAALKFSTRAPSSTQSMMADASCSGVALGMSPLVEGVSAKMGRTSKVQPGHMAGAAEPRLAIRMPATYVPCRHAALEAREHPPRRAPSFPWTSRILRAVR